MFDAINRPKVRAQTECGFRVRHEELPEIEPVRITVDENWMSSLRKEDNKYRPTERIELMYIRTNLSPNRSRSPSPLLASLERLSKNQSPIRRDNIPMCSTPPMLSKKKFHFTESLSKSWDIHSFEEKSLEHVWQSYKEKPEPEIHSYKPLLRPIELPKIVEPSLDEFVIHQLTPEQIDEVLEATTEEPPVALTNAVRKHTLSHPPKPSNLMSLDQRLALLDESHEKSIARAKQLMATMQRSKAALQSAIVALSENLTPEQKRAKMLEAYRSRNKSVSPPQEKKQKKKKKKTDDEEAFVFVYDRHKKEYEKRPKVHMWDSTDPDARVRTL